MIQPTFIHEFLATYPLTASCGKFQLPLLPRKWCCPWGEKNALVFPFPAFSLEKLLERACFCFFSRRSWERWCNGPAGEFGFSFISYQLLRLFEPRRAGRSSKRERLLGCKKHFSFWLFGFQSADFRIGCWIQTNVSNHLLWGLVFDKACMYYVHGRYGK